MLLNFNLKKIASFLLCTSCLSTESFAMMEDLGPREAVPSQTSVSRQSPISQFEQRAQLSMKLLKENNHPINFESFIKTCPTIDENTSDQDIIKILSEVQEVAKAIRKSLTVKPTIFESSLLDTKFKQWKSSFSVQKNKNSHASKEGIKQLAEDVLQLEAKFYDLYQKHGDSQFVTAQNYITQVKLLADQMEKIGLQTFSTFKKRKLFSLSTLTSDQVASIALLGVFFIKQGDCFHEAWTCDFSQLNKVLKPQEEVNCIVKNIESLEHASQLYERVLEIGDDEVVKDANETIAGNIFTLLKQLEVYIVQHSDIKSTDVKIPFSSKELKSKKQTLLVKIRKSEEEKRRIQAVSVISEKQKIMTNKSISKKAQLEAQKDVLQHLQKTDIDMEESAAVSTTLEDPTFLKLAYQYAPKIDGSPCTADSVLNLTTLILFYAGEYDKALVRFKLYEEEMKGQLTSDALVFRAFLKSFTGDRSELIARHNDLKLRRKLEKERHQKKMIGRIQDKIESSKSEAKPNMETKVSRQVLPSNMTSMISSHDVLLLEDNVISEQDRKAEKKKRHEEKLEKKEDSASSDEERSLQTSIPQKSLKSKETSPKVEPQFYLTSTAWRVHLSIESNEWKFTKDDLKTYFENLGCLVKESRGKGGHQGAELPTRLVIKDDSDTLLSIIPIGGFFTLPAWDQDFVPFYLRKEISNVRSRFGAFGKNVHEGQRPIEDKQKIFAEHE